MQLPPVISRLDLVGRAGLEGIDTARAAECVDDLVETDHLARLERDGKAWLCRREPEALADAHYETLGDELREAVCEDGNDSDGSE